MKKRILCILITLILLACLIVCFTGCQEKSDGTEVTLCLDWTPNTNHTGFYVALAKGFYRDLGLDVKIVQPSESTSSLMVAAGQVQFGIEAQDTMAAALIGEKPLDIVAVAAILQHNTSSIMSLKSEKILTPKDLQNKTYATWDSPIELAVIKELVEQDGGDYSKVKLVPNVFTDEAAALSTDQTDSIWIFYGWSGVYADHSDVDVDFMEITEFGPEFDYYTPVIISSNKFLKENPETAKAFMTATKKGYEFATENHQEAAEILLDMVPEIGEETFIKASQEWISSQYISDGDSWGKIDPERWNRFYSWLNDNVELPGKLEDNTGFTNDYLE